MQCLEITVCKDDILSKAQTSEIMYFYKYLVCVVFLKNSCDVKMENLILQCDVKKT